MFSNQGQDNEIQSDSTDSSNTQPSNWQGPKQRSLVISARVPFATFRSNLSSGLNCWVHSHTDFESVTSKKKVSFSVFALLAREPVIFISYQVAIPVPFISFRSKSFGLAYCWVHSRLKTTADLFQASHSIQFACSKRSFISARALISTFDGSTSSSKMACWVRTLTVNVPLLHQTNHAVLSEWWYTQQNYVPFISCWDLHQSAKAALKAIAEVQASADKIKSNNVSSFDDKPSSTFQLVVVSVDWISKGITSLHQIKANANLQTTNNFRRGSPSHFNVCCLHELIVGPAWNPTFNRMTPSLLFKYIVDSILGGARFAPTTFRIFHQFSYGC
jgi:hypothetical protein